MRARARTGIAALLLVGLLAACSGADMATDDSAAEAPAMDGDVGGDVAERDMAAEESADDSGDAGGGETGPSLVDSELVKRDKTGAEIAAVIRNGRPEKGMPKFDLSETAMAGVVAFINNAQATNSSNGKRRGVLPADLRTGDAALGKQYFETQGRCATCHSATGDLAHVGARLIGLKLEQRMLYPDHSKAKATVTLPGGKSFSGEIAYNDEFTIAIRDAEGRYRSWPKVPALKIKMDAPAEAHAELLSKYTDADIHNLMAYLQALK